MSLQQVMTAAAIIAVSVVGTGAVALILRALGVLPRSSGRVDGLRDLRCCDAVS